MDYESFKRITRVRGDLISMGKNPDKMSSFFNMPMLVCIKKHEKIDDLIFLEVGNSKFPIRVVEMGLFEVEGNGGDG